MIFFKVFFSIKVWSLNFGVYHNDLEGLLKHRVSDSVGLGWGPKIFISNKFPDDDDAGSGTSFWEPLVYIDKFWVTQGLRTVSYSSLFP